MPTAKYRDPATGQYVPILGSGNAFTGAQVASSAPTPRGVGDLWVDTSATVLEWDTEWKPLLLLNGWTNYGAPFHDAGYRKLPGGLVLLKGLIRNGTTNIVGTLQAGYRPGRQVIIPSITHPNSLARINVNSAGLVFFESALYSNTWVSLDGAVFLAEL